MWNTAKLTDASRILAYLETDRLYAAYAIGDLDPGLFEQSTWAGADVAGRLQSLVLHYRGLNPPALFLMGNADGLRAILENVLCPGRVYLTCRASHLRVARRFYGWEQIIPMWRMALEPARFRPVKGECLRLTPAHSGQLGELYALGGGNAFSPEQMEQGVFYGVHLGGQLVAAAGTHLVSQIYGVAALGNVFTRPSYRGRGYATAATSAVVAGLLQLGIRDVILNVEQANASAIRVYEQLGFERFCPFVEGPASAKTASNHDPTSGAK